MRHSLNKGIAFLSILLLSSAQVFAQETSEGAQEEIGERFSNPLPLRIIRDGAPQEETGEPDEILLVPNEEFPDETLEQVTKPAEKTSTREITEESESEEKSAEPTPDLLSPPESSSEPLISTSELPEITLESLGLTTSEKANLPVTVWEHNDRVTVEALLPALPSAYSSPALRQLVVRLLTTGGPPPEGEKTLDLLEARIRLLMQLNELEKAEALLNNVPANHLTAEYERLKLDTALWKGDFQTACALAQEAVTRYQEPYFQHALVFCQALGDNPAAVELGLKLLEEQKTLAGSYFLKLIETITEGKPAKLVSYPEPFTALDVALFAKAREPFPVTLIDEGSPLLLRGIALTQHQETPTETQLLAGEQAVLKGSLSAEELRNLYRRAKLPDTIAKEIEKNPSVDTVWKRVLWFHELNDTWSDETRATLLMKLAHAYKSAGLEAIAPSVFQHELASLPVTKTVLLLPVARLAIRAAAEREDYHAVKSWLHAWQERTPGATLNFLKEVVEIAQHRKFSKPDAAKAFRLIQTSKLDETGIAVASRLINIHAAFGHIAPKDLRQPILTASATSGRSACLSSSFVPALKPAAMEKHTAEAIMLSALAVDRRPLRRLCDATAYEVLRSLHETGLKQDTEALAADFLLAFPL